MREEEILQYLKNKATELKEDISRVEDYVNTGNDEEELDAIQGILDLYNKQKEENNKNYYEWRHLEAEVSNNYISKDKIRDKIKELEEKEKNCNFTGLITECEIKIETLKELLKEYN